jgi:hypothetical protein
MKKSTNPWAAIDAIVKTSPEPTGSEWFTADQYTERYGGNVRHNMAKLRRDARFEVWKDATNRRPNKYRLNPGKHPVKP